jgi:uncharacterized protein YggE
MKALAALAALAVAALPFASVAQTTPPRERGTEISVTGTATVSRPPDKASFGLAIVTTEESAASSTSKNNAIYNELKAKLGSGGIGEAAIKTQGYNVQFIPRPKTPPQNDYGTRYGYTTTRTIEVDTSVDGVGKAIDLAVAAGATDISNVSYGLRDRKGAYNQALAAAVADARGQAEALAAAAGMKIAAVRYITTRSQNIGQPVMSMAAARMAAPAPQVPTDIAPAGPIDVTAGVTVSYSAQ